MGCGLSGCFSRVLGQRGSNGEEGDEGWVLWASNGSVGRVLDSVRLDRICANAWHECGTAQRIHLHEPEIRIG